MSDYTRVDKNVSTYTKVDKKDTEQGWFKQGWFLDWLSSWGIYRKVEKVLSNYTKADR